jgi:hypothetical protein
MLKAIDKRALSGADGGDTHIISTVEFVATTTAGTTSEPNLHTMSDASMEELKNFVPVNVTRVPPMRGPPAGRTDVIVA